MNLLGAKERVVRTALKIYNEKLVTGTSGNVSEFDRESALMFITPSGTDYTLMKADDIVVMELDGTIREGSLKPSSEWRLHAELYRELITVNAVIHTHSPRASAFAVLHEGIPIVLTEMIQFLGGDIPVAEYAMPGTAEVGLNAVKTIGKRRSCLLANHGVVVVGKNLEETCLGAFYVEDAATVYHFSKQVGTPKPIPADAIAALREKWAL